MAKTIREWTQDDFTGDWSYVDVLTASDGEAPPIVPVAPPAYQPPTEVYGLDGSPDPAENPPYLPERGDLGLPVAATVADPPAPYSEPALVPNPPVCQWQVDASGEFADVCEQVPYPAPGTDTYFPNAPALPAPDAPPRTGSGAFPGGDGTIVTPPPTDPNSGPIIPVAQQPVNAPLLPVIPPVNTWPWWVWGLLALGGFALVRSVKP